MNEVINQDFNIQLMQLLEDDDEDDVCLIDGMPLDNECIELVCKHKFNYLSLLQEIKVQRKYNNLEVQKLSGYQIKCPYCRTIHNGVLPYRDNLYQNKLRGINWPPSKVLKTKKCTAIIKSGKRKGEPCNKWCVGKLCPRHEKLAAKKSTNAALPFCKVILKSGKRKNEMCGCKCKKNEDKCGRHISKKKVLNTIVSI